jgi:hypothetical protein
VGRAAQPRILRSLVCNSIAAVDNKELDRVVTQPL